jgi:predicted ATPase
MALQSVYPRIEDVIPHRVQPGQLTLQFKERGISEPLGQGSVSDGVLHALALLVMLEGSDRSRGVLAIEEPENAIHPWSVRAMVAHAQDDPKRQILITTHSETVVNAVRDPASLFIVDIEDRLGTVINAAHDREDAIDSILANSGQKLGDLWMDGSLGGVPKADQ